MLPALTTDARTPADEELMACARLIRLFDAGLRVKEFPLTERVKLVEELIEVEYGSATAGRLALLIVAVADPMLVTLIVYSPGRAPAAAVAVAAEGLEEVAASDCAPTALSKPVTELCRAVNAVFRSSSAVDFPFMSCSWFCSWVSGSEAIATARVSTAWRSFA